MASIIIWGWDDTNKEWVKVQVTVDGKLKIKAG